MSEDISEKIKSYNLFQNYPNPFNSATVIQFKIAEPNRVDLRVVDVLGRKVSELTDKIYQPGIHRINWDAAADYSSGIYFCLIKIGEFKSVKKMLLLR